MDRVRFEALDGMRGFAALAVLLLHVCQAHAPWVFPHGYLAVDFFFNLSGFVIAYAYEARLASGLPVRRFLYARIVRLYPLIVAGAAIGLVGYSKLYDPSVLGIILVTGLLLIPTPFAPESEGRVALAVNPPSWSLFFEIAINIVFALIATRLTDRLLACLVAISAAVLLATVLAFGSASFGASWPNFAAGTARVCFSFFAGVAIFRLWRNQKLRAWRVPFPVLLVGLAVLLSVPDRAEINAPFDALAILIAFPVIVACGANVTVSGPLLPLCRLSGDLSYPIYVLQGGMAHHMRDLPTKFGAQGLTALAIILATVAAYLLLCWLALKLYDEPVRRFLSLKGKERAARVAA